MKEKLLDIHCPKCGAPATFDIPSQNYLCTFCDGVVGIDEAIKESEGYRSLQHEKLKDEIKQFKLLKTSCTGCGSEILFQEDEPLSSCVFCGRSLVRSAYLQFEEFPESIIPFAITKEEAKELLKKWCETNSSKQEAKHLLPLIDSLQAFYLPYELLHGPVHMEVSRMTGSKDYPCEGFLTNTFVNRSKQLDNLLLDGMEPFDTDYLVPFDFSYIAGHGVKISDISELDLEKRAKEETRSVYKPFVQKTLETKAVSIQVNSNSLIRLPILMPVYYIAKDNTMAAINGQTGKISVRGEKESHYFFLPWWLKAILYTLLFSVIVFIGFHLFGMDLITNSLLTGLLAFFYIIVTLCAYSDTTRNEFAVVSGREIFTSGEDTFYRENGKLLMRKEILERKVDEPMFFEKIEGKNLPVILRFTTPLRILKVVLLIFICLFFPVILALFVNGFNFSKINLGGSAVWFCIAVPIIPIYLLMYGLVHFYNHPWIYYEENGRIKRYKEKRKLTLPKGFFKDVLRALFIPPMSLAVWFIIFSFITIVYLTAGY